MALRPFAFGVRLRHGDRTLRVRRHAAGDRRYVVEDSHPRRRSHATLEGALRDLARTWRSRLH